MVKKCLAVGIAFLFLIIALTPMVIGFNTKHDEQFSEIEETLDKLSYLCTTPEGFDEAKYDYYKEELLNYYSNDKVVPDVETDKIIVQEDFPSSIIGPINSSWPMKCHDLHHTGRSPNGTADISYNEIWRYEFDYSLDTDPAIGEDGTIYVGGATVNLPWYLYAINPNGTLKWRYYAGASLWLQCPVIADDGIIYIGTWSGSLHAINPNGTLKWTFGSDMGSDPVIGEDGTIYFGTFEGAWTDAKIFAVNPDGTEKWNYPTGYHTTSDPAIGDDGTIYIGSGDTYLYALYPNGTLRWRFKTGDDIKGPVSIAEDGTVYICSYDNYLYAIYPNGTLRWKTEPWWYGSSSNPSIGADGTIYVGWGPRMFSFNPENGDIGWVFEFGGHNMHSSPAICADGIIYIGLEIGERDGGEIIAINADGTERWRERLSNQWADSSPCISSDGTIYISSSSKDPFVGRLHAFGISDPNAPIAPTIIGENEGVAGEEYEYTFSTIDPNGDDVFFNIEWGDGEFEDWFGPFASGEEVTVSHTWNDRGTYTIKARAKDTDNLWGPWGEVEVTMPINQQNQYPLLDLLKNRFPFLHQLFQYFLQQRL